MIISYDDSLIFDMHIIIKMISRYYHSNYHPNINEISKISILKQITSYQDILINYNTAP